MAAWAVAGARGGQNLSVGTGVGAAEPSIVKRHNFVNESHLLIWGELQLGLTR